MDLCTKVKALPYNVYQQEGYSMVEQTLETRLALIDSGRKALAEASTMVEVKDVRDKAEAIRAYARQQSDSLYAQNSAAELKLRAERKLGQLVEQIPKEPGKRTDLTWSHDVTRLSEMGITKAQSSRWQMEASVPEKQFEQYVAETKQDKELTTVGLVRIALVGHHR